MGPFFLLLCWSCCGCSFSFCSPPPSKCSNILASPTDAIVGCSDGPTSVPPPPNRFLFSENAARSACCSAVLSPLSTLDKNSWATHCSSRVGGPHTPYVTSSSSSSISASACRDAFRGRLRWRSSVAANCARRAAEYPSGVRWTVP